MYEYGAPEFRRGQRSFWEIAESLRTTCFKMPNTTDKVCLPSTSAATTIFLNRRRLLRVTPRRNRLFQAFLEHQTSGDLGTVQAVLGRQILRWGDTVLANTNPLDTTFGGFFMRHDPTDPVNFVDERRMPLNTAKVVYSPPVLPPGFLGFSVEAYGAWDRTVAFAPGIAAGSPWYSPLGPYDRQTLNQLRSNSPGRARGGGRITMQVPDPGILPDPLPLQLTLANYWTILDVQAVRLLPSGKPLSDAMTGKFNLPFLLAQQFGPRVQVIGASVETTPKVDPDWPTVTTGSTAPARWVSFVEMALIRDEALFRYATDPTEFRKLFFRVREGTFDTLSRKDTVNLSAALDLWDYACLQTLGRMHVTPALLYKYVVDADPRQAVPIPATPARTSFVVQPAGQIITALDVSWRISPPDMFEPVGPLSQYLLLKAGHLLLYDFQGVWFLQPRVELLFRPQGTPEAQSNPWLPEWRLFADYSIVTGQFRAPIGTFRDRDNVRIQLEARLPLPADAPSLRRRIAPVDFLLGR